MSKSVYKTPEGREEIQSMCRKLYMQWPVESQMYSLQTSWGETHVIESGNADAPPLVLLHGSSGNSASWMGEAARLSKEFRVFAVDLPGQPGLSSEKRMSVSIENVSAWMESLLDSLGLERVYLAGISLGGYYALTLASSAPERVSGMVLIAASGLAPAKIGFILKSIPLMFLGSYGNRKIYEAIYASKEIPPEVITTGNTINRHFIPLTEGIPVLSDEELSQIQSPILYIGGDQDVLIRTEESCRRLKKIRRAWETKLIQGKGHVITDTAGDIISFFQKR